MEFMSASGFSLLLLCTRKIVERAVDWVKLVDQGPWFTRLRSVHEDMGYMGLGTFVTCLYVTWDRLFFF